MSTKELKNLLNQNETVTIVCGDWELIKAPNSRLGNELLVRDIRNPYDKFKVGVHDEMIKYFMSKVNYLKRKLDKLNLSDTFRELLTIDIK